MVVVYLGRWEDDKTLERVRRVGSVASPARSVLARSSLRLPTRVRRGVHEHRSAFAGCSSSSPGRSRSSSAGSPPLRERPRIIELRGTTRPIPKTPTAPQRATEDSLLTRLEVTQERLRQLPPTAPPPASTARAGPGHY